MSDRTISLSLALGCVVKGAIVSLLLLVLADATFVDALIVAAVSACITGTFLVVAAHINKRAAETKMEEVKALIEAQAVQENRDEAQEEVERRAFLDAMRKGEHGEPPGGTP